MTLQKAVESMKNHDEQSEQAFQFIYKETYQTALAVIKRIMSMLRGITNISFRKLTYRCISSSAHSMMERRLWPGLKS